MPSDKRVEGLIELVVVVWDFSHTDKALDEKINQLDRKAVSPNADYDGVEGLAKMLLHQEHFLPFKQLTFRLVRFALAFTRFARNGLELRRRNRRLVSSQH